MLDLFGEEIKPERPQSSTKVFTILGASAHSVSNRERHDLYCTQPEAVEMLLELENFSQRILEPCCGLGHISEVLKSHGHDVESRDKYDYGYGIPNCDFLMSKEKNLEMDIITNPPYIDSISYVKKAYEMVACGHKVAMFLRLAFAEGKQRRKFFQEHPPVRVWVSSSRLTCGKNGREWNPSAVAYSWWIWEKGYTGPTELRWFN